MWAVDLALAVVFHFGSCAFPASVPTFALFPALAV
jgi:hypothetical protein